MNLTFKHSGKEGGKKEDIIITEKNCTIFKYRFSKVGKVFVVVYTVVEELVWVRIPLIQTKYIYLKVKFNIKIECTFYIYFLCHHILYPNPEHFMLDKYQ